MNFIQKKDRGIVFLLPDDLAKPISDEFIGQVEEGAGHIELRFSGADDLSLSAAAELVHFADRMAKAGRGTELTAPGPVVDNVKICGMDVFGTVRAG